MPIPGILGRDKDQIDLPGLGGQRRIEESVPVGNGSWRPADSYTGPVVSLPIDISVDEVGRSGSGTDENELSTGTSGQTSGRRGYPRSIEG